MQRTTLEWAPFRVKDGVSEDDVIAASARLQADFLARQDGFLSRRLVRAADGGYIDLVLWRSREAAERAMQNVEKSEACALYFGLMQSDCAEAGAGVLHCETVAEYGSAPGGV